MSSQTLSQSEITGMIESLRVATLIPEVYTAYRPVVVDALALFLSRLPAPRLQAIMRDQARLGGATPAERLVALMHACPTLHKLGQVIARHRALEPSFRVELQRLESMEPKTPSDQVRAALQRELPGVIDRELIIEQAIAEASVAVVVPFEWHGSDDESRRRGVFKILKPGIEERLGEELEIWGEIGAFLDEDCHRYGLPDLDYRETLDRVRDLLMHEVRLDREQENLAEAAKTLRDDDVTIPALFDLCTPRGTAMTRVDGCKVTAVADWPMHRRQRLASSIAASLIGQPFWSTAPSAMFHADPHAGNLLVDDDGRLGVIDWSLVGRLGKHERVQLAQIMLGGAMRDPRRIESAVDALAENTIEAPRVRWVIDDALHELRANALPGLDWMVRFLDDAVRIAGVRLGGDLLLFRKALLTLGGVVDDVCPGFDVDRPLISGGMQQLMRDWPMRFWESPTSRAGATHLSNLDITALTGSLPLAAWRAWVGTCSVPTATL